MSLYLAIKWIHILSSVLMVGTGFGSAYFMYFTNRSRDIAAQASVARLVVRADWWFTAPTVILQPLTGVMLVHLAGFSWSAPWLVVTLVLYGVAGACWLPVVWLQIRMAALAQEALRTATPLLQVYWQYAKRWEYLGYAAFLAMLIVFYLMVAKPSLGG